ncbi:MAG: MerR family transcriptional regulator [Thermodesulfobacteriota bacterium]
MSQGNSLFTISEVSRRLNIPKHTLRFWEREFEGIILPPRTKGRQRRYTPENVAVIEEIKRRRQEGMSLPEIKNRLDHSRSGHPSNSGEIDLLANRVAEVVKAEVYHFFESGKGS